ncbi:hypothetical protein JVT61DRAFT_1939 [Boletus reticuloceps]|uniref:C2H2-type domain-containing protein n=1 Tax=Boletus reticuloceps TaxID=495285 RepID=A0A8I3A1W9_9AGAM|nr:hypothetical protein JVT61DRAFT_1939 [Boletus reticuloceps]
MSDALLDQSPDAVSPECRPCGLRFESLRSLCLHRSARHSILSFSSCSKEYVVAPDQNGYACPLGNCSQLYRNRGGLQRHLRKQHGVKSGVPNPSTSSSGGRLQGTASDQPFTPPLDEPASLNVVGRVSSEWGQEESPFFSQGRSNGTSCIPNLSALPGDAEPKGTPPFTPPHDEPSSNVVGDISSERGQVLETRGLSEGRRMVGASWHGSGTPASGIHAPDGDADRDAFAESETVAGGNGECGGRPSVALVPGKRYLETTPMLDDLGLWRHSGLRVLICRRCKVALSSKMAVGHLKKQHGIIVPEAGRKELQNLCTQNKVYENPHKVPLPRVGGPPVEGIAPPTAGLSCAAGSDCRYSVCDLQAMIRHGREEHKGGTLATTKYRASKVQALFLGVGHVYFEVDPELTASSDADTRDYLRAVFLQEAGFDEVVPADGPRDRPPLLNITHWDEFMPEIRENVDQRRAAHALKGKHAVDEQEGIFEVLQRTVQSHHKTTREKLEHSANRFLLRKVLVNGPDFPTAQ